MNAVSAQIDALLCDARRAAQPGAVGDDPDHAGVLFAHAVDASRSQTISTHSNLSQAIDGAGFFMIQQSDGSKAYTRLGDFEVRHGVLTDGRGRAVLGTSSCPIDVGDSTALEISPDGDVTGVSRGARRSLGTIALAVFDAPGRLARETDTIVRAGTQAGHVHLFKPGSPNVGKLVSHSLENAAVALDADLERAWQLQQQASAVTTGAYANDECERDALGLVK